MNRAIAAGLSFVALSLASNLAVAADAPFSPNDVKGKITYYTHWTSYITDGLFAKWIDQFKKEYPGVTDVDVEGITTYQETMAPLIAYYAQLGNFKTVDTSGPLDEVTAQVLEKIRRHFDDE